MERNVLFINRVDRVVQPPQRDSSTDVSSILALHQIGFTLTKASPLKRQHSILFTVVKLLLVINTVDKTKLLYSGTSILQCGKGTAKSYH